MSKANYPIIIFLLSLFFLYPVFAHVLMFELGYMVDMLPHGQFWVVIQVFLSAPAIIILGLILFFKYDKSVFSKAWGFLLFLIGVYWLYFLINDLINKAA